MTGHDIKWRVKTTLEKYRDGETEPYEVLEDEGNLLVYGGASVIWQKLIGGASGGDVFSNTYAHIGVGDSGTAAAADQTDLQAATNKHYEPMDATYPTHTDSTSASSAATVTFRSTFETTDANFAWNEWGIFNALSAGRMLNRKAQSFGTKTSADSWVLTIALTLSG